MANAYLIAGARDAVLFDVPMLKSDALNLVDAIERAGKCITTVIISHAHPDHFLSLEAVEQRFPSALNQTRAYLKDFRQAVKAGNAADAEKIILDKYPAYHARQFLSAFILPAYFPGQSSQ